PRWTLWFFDIRTPCVGHGFLISKLASRGKDCGLALALTRKPNRPMSPATNQSVIADEICKVLIATDLESAVNDVYCASQGVYALLECVLGSEDDDSTNAIVWAVGAVLNAAHPAKDTYYRAAENGEAP